MRIGIDAHLVTSRPTGVGKTITRTIEAMADAAPGDEFVIYANRRFPATLGNRPNCRVVRTPLISKSATLRILHERFVVPRRVRRQRIDVFYAPGCVFPGELDVPVVLGTFDLNVLKHPGRVRFETAVYHRHALPLSARRARLIAVPTRAVARDVERVLKAPRHKIRVVPCGVDERFRASTPDAAGVAARHGVAGPYVLFVGNIEPNKNLVRLVEAFFAAKVHRKLPHRLVIAGKRGHRAGEVDKAVRMLLGGDDVTFPGYVPDDDLPALYAGADAFAYLSYAEGFGVAPLEAMLSGTPTVTSKDPALVEVTGDGALHCPADDLAAIREALEKVLVDREFAAELARNGRKAAARYSWAETGRRMLVVLREAAESRA